MLSMRHSALDSGLYELTRAADTVDLLISDSFDVPLAAAVPMLAAAHFKLDNLMAMIDCNGIQLSGRTCDIMDLEPLIQKWQAFGWHVIEIDGHDFDQILGAFLESEKTKGRPTVITARTIKGKGVSFMENNVAFHGKAPTPEEAERALKELE